MKSGFEQMIHDARDTLEDGEREKRQLMAMVYRATHKTYKGTRAGVGKLVSTATVTVNGQPLNPCNELVNHSPDGFEWGYAGSGPAQLALAILVDLKGEAYALKHYQNFKLAWVAGIQSDSWEITGEEVSKILVDIGADG